MQVNSQTTNLIFTEFFPFANAQFGFESIIRPYSPEELRSLGFVQHVGEAKGQLSDWRLPLDDGSELHVRVFENYCTVHRDKVSAVNNPLGHLISDAPHWFVLLGAVVGGAMGYYSARSEEGVFGGVILGAIIGDLLRGNNGQI